MDADIFINDLNDLKRFVADFVPRLRPGHQIGLVGPLGAGKTTFVRLAAEVLGVEEEVSSPTYVLQHRYLKDGSVVIDHWDLFRVREVPAEIIEREESQAIQFIEWSDRFPELTRELNFVISIDFDAGGEDGSALQRRLTVTSET